MSRDFIEITDANFEQELEGQTMAMVDFYATWCGSCRMTAPVFKKLANEFDLPLYKLEVEKNPRIKSMLDFEGLPTLALFRKGEPLAAINATKEEVLRTFIHDSIKDL